MDVDEFEKIIENHDETTSWYLKEIAYCLQTYGGLSRHEAKKSILSSHLVAILEDDPRWLWREPAYYWAMAILHGFDSNWWQDEELWKQHNNYVEERHHPPIPTEKS